MRSKGRIGNALPPAGRERPVRELRDAATDWYRMRLRRVALQRQFDRLRAELPDDSWLGERAVYAVNDPWVDLEAQFDTGLPDA